MEVIKSVCAICPSTCGILIYKEKDKIEKITGDPSSFWSKGALCRKGRAILEYVTHKDRIRYPLKRKGKRGDGDWERISWDEALDTIASEMKKARSSYGPESVLFIRGAPKGLADILFMRLANAFGSPNVTSMGFLCFVPRLYAYNATFGSFLYPDYDHPPSTICLWGMNPKETFPPLYRKILEAKKKGSKIIVIDPRHQGLCDLADLWIRPKPSSDLALALFAIKMILEKNLYAQAFVERWTKGFEELKEYVSNLNSSDLEKITWVSEEEIKRFVEIYTENRPSAIQEGNGIEQSLNTFQTQRAIYILEAITGNIGIPGGKIRWKNPKVVERYGASFTLQNLIPEEKRKVRIGSDLLAPFAHYASPQAIVKSLCEDHPSRPRVAFIMGGNILLSWPDSKRTLEALNKLDFIFVSDLFLTPTCHYADLVLPSASFLEFDSIYMPPDFTFFVWAQKKVLEIEEAKSDIWIINELGKRLDLSRYFFRDENELFNEVLKEEGITFEEFKEKGILIGEKEYRFYEKEGFRTDSKKVEIFSSRLKSYGYDPIPMLHSETISEAPLLLTSYKPHPFRHTNFRQVQSTRAIHPEPLLFLSEKLALKIGVEEGEWVIVKNERGSVKAKAKFDPYIDERVVVLEHGWWFPERWQSFLEFNLNVLTSSEPPFSRETATPVLRGIPCEVLKVQRE